MKLKDIKPNPNNPRLIKDERFTKLVNSIQDFPKMMKLRPIVVNEDMMILGGNMRWRACEELGMEEIPDEWVSVADGLTEAEQRQFIIEDNVPFGEWDWDVLATEWNQVEIEHWGVDVDVYTDGNNNNEWGVKYDRMEGENDGTEDLLGFKLSSMWYNMPRKIDGITERLIELPKDKKTTMSDKYSRTTPEEIRRIVVTYMRPGDYFLENCCGWSTFGGIAKLHGYSGKGVDIWDTAVEYSRKQIKAIKNEATVEIIEADGLNLPFENDSFDFIYCNPPFMDAEMYSGKPNDIACKDIDEFRNKFIKLMSENFRVVKKGCLCTITIGDQRKNKKLIPHQMTVIQSGLNAGFILWDFVICEVLGAANVMRKKSLEIKRTPKNHEYVITFKKI